MVKCKQCKKEVSKNIAIKVVEEGKKVGSYFCNEEEYRQYLINKQEKQRLKELQEIEKQKFNEVDVYIASEILGYDVGQITPPFLKKRIKKLAESYDYEVIKLCLENIKNDLIYYLKNIEDERHMVNYIMVVIESNINDAYKIWKHKKETATKQENKQIDIDLFNDFETVNHRVNSEKGIMDFLDEGDY